MLKRELLVVAFLIPSLTYAQMGIGTLMPNPSAELDIQANYRGLLIPRIPLKNLKDNTTIKTGNVESLLLYNTTSNTTLHPGFYYWYNNHWNRLKNTDKTTTAQPIKIIKKDYTIHKADRIILGKTSTQDITITLPDPEAYKGKKYTVKKEDHNESHYVRIKGNIGGISSGGQLYTALPYTGWDLVSDGKKWRIVNKF